MTYTEYIKSREWLIKRTEVMANPYYGRPNTCFLCRRKKNLIVHHLTYDRLGNEREDDLMILCSTCHNKTHTVDGEHTSDKKRIIKFPFLFKMYMIYSVYSKNKITWEENKIRKPVKKVSEKKKVMKRTGLPALLHASMFAYLNARKDKFISHDDPTQAFIEFFEKKKRIYHDPPLNARKRQIYEEYLENKDIMKEYLQVFFEEYNEKQML